MQSLPQICQYNFLFLWVAALAFWSLQTQVKSLVYTDWLDTILCFSLPIYKWEITVPTTLCLSKQEHNALAPFSHPRELLKELLQLLKGASPG